MKSTPKNTLEFIRSFQNYLDCFVVIGGTPTLIYLEQRQGNAPRATKDLDIVILDISEDGKGKDFLKALSNYVKDCGYESKHLSSGKAQSYRFTNPQSDLAPQIIEISTRRKEGLPLDVPAQRLQEFEMSAIVCEPYFVDLLKIHSELIVVDEITQLALPVAKISLLILMKAYAVENLQKSTKSEDQEKTKKHLNDILRLTDALIEKDRLSVPKAAYQHLEVVLAERDEHFVRSRLDACGWKGRSSDSVEKTLRDFIQSE